ncbi:hypothetical protein PHYSODRAFT_252122 [Phytophthora sojae]|uniref:RNase H type-1 domain-containing protein n=1 Tax=Phytophthora sojae (strain P6497) TaxID=1094619 RepID=G4YRW0_PHYSP|nr:hypothetical protein PHYSODRAFT_252122 [Phytophthora sojae]EGZ22937.1 hypothetical protein PHYSODRAFT_252122 [Phytophthora sojae]|eukprot:XP_009518225.1 hypothetical protein PHYSODRAFT_252122 [Phytophthora sojae]
MLRHPDRTKPFVIIPHANQWVACAVLGQEYDGVIQPQRDEDGLAAILGAGITPREHLDEVAESLIPAKGRVKAPPVLPEWTVIEARGYTLDGVTVNAEYYGLLKGMTMALQRDIADLVVVGDSRIVIQQVQGLINCNQPPLQRRLAECHVLKEKFRTVGLVHVKREYNQAADYLTSKILAVGEDCAIQDDEERQHLEVVSKIREQLVKTITADPDEQPTDSGSPSDSTPGMSAEVDPGPGPESAPLTEGARVMAVLTRTQAGRTQDEPPPMGPLEYQAERWRRIKAHQEQDDYYLMEIRDFLNGETDDFSPHRLRKIAKAADFFALDARGVLY